MPTTLNFGQLGSVNIEETLDESQIPAFLAENGDAIQAALIAKRQEEVATRARQEAAAQPDTLMEEVGSGAAQLARGAVGMVGRGVKAAGRMTTAQPVFPGGAFVPSPQMLAMQRERMAMTPEQRLAEETAAAEADPLTKAGRAVVETAQGLPVLPASEQRIPGKAAEAVGTTVGLFPAALAGPASPAVAGAMYGLSAGESGAEDARRVINQRAEALLAEGDFEGARELLAQRPRAESLAFALNAPIGAVTEGALGVVGGLTSKLPLAARAAGAVTAGAARMVGPRAARAAGGAAVGGVSELLQEGSEKLLSNAAAMAVYDPDRTLGADLVEEALYGGGVGALFGGVRGALRGGPVARRVEPARPTVDPTVRMESGEGAIVTQPGGGQPGAPQGPRGLLPGPEGPEGGAEVPQIQGPQGPRGLLPAPQPQAPRVFTPPYTGPGRDVIVTPFTGATRPLPPGRQQLRRSGVETGLFAPQGQQDEAGPRVAEIPPDLLEEGLRTAEEENVPSPIDEAIMDGTLKRQLNLPENVSNSYTLAGSVSGRYLNGENVDPDVLAALDESLPGFLRTLEGRINAAIERNVNEREVDALIGLHQRLTRFGAERRNDAAFLALKEEERYQNWLKWAAGGRKGEPPSTGSTRRVGAAPTPPGTPPGTPPTPTGQVIPAPEKWTEETMEADAQSVGGPGSITPGDAEGTAVLDRPAGLGKVQVITGKPWMADAPRDPDVTAEGVWVLMEAEDVVTSFQGNAYNQKIQPRIVDTIERQQKADEYGMDLRGHRLAESGTTDTGGIIIDEKAQAISGNNRLRGVRRAISGALGEKGTRSMAKYKAWLRANATSLGFTPEQVDAMRHPMAFRLALSYPNTTKLRFAETANDSPAISPTIIDAAVRVAEAIRSDPSILLKLNPSEAGDMLVKQNEPFMRAVQALSGMGEKFQDNAGNLTKEIEAFANKALLAYLFGSKDYRDTAFIIERAGDFGFRQAINGVAKNAGLLAQLAGTPYEIGSVFRDAFKAIVDIKSSGLSLEEYVDQATLGIEGNENPEVKAMVGVLMGIQSAKEADEMFKFYAESAQKAMKDLAVGGGLWGGAEIPGRPEVLTAAARQARTARQARAEDAARRKKQEEQGGKTTEQGSRTEEGQDAGAGGATPPERKDAEGAGAGGVGGPPQGKKKRGRGPRVKTPKAPKTTEGTGKGPKTTEGGGKGPKTTEGTGKGPKTPPPTPPPTTPPPPTTAPPRESFLSEADDAAIEAEFAKLRGKMFSGVDPEVIGIGIRIANIYIKAGVRSFARYAGQVKAKAPDLWERIKPYLASFWNSAIVGVDDAEEVTPSQARAIIADIDKPPGGGGGTPPPGTPPPPPPPPRPDALPETVTRKLKANKLKAAFIGNAASGPIYEVKGKGTFAAKETIKRSGGRWEPGRKRWVIGADGIRTLAELLPGAAEDASGKVLPSASYEADAGLRRLREQAESRPDESGTPERLRGLVSAPTRALIDRGAAMNIPANVLAEQAEDVGMIVNAFETRKPLFILGNDAGTGKTFVLGAAIRELRERGARKIVYVTLREELIDQIKEDLADFGLQGVEFVTYTGLRDAAPRDSDVLIFDEAHYVKRDYDSQQGKQAKEWMKRARFTIMASATPYENPVQMRYLEATGIFRELGGFPGFAGAFGATIGRAKDGTLGTPTWRKTKTFEADSLAAREYIRKLGIFTQRPMQLPPNQVETSLVKVQSDPKYKAIHDRFTAAAGVVDGSGSSGLPLYTAMWVKNLRKRLLEYAKLAPAMDRAKQAMDEGRWPIIFVETRSERILDIPDLMRRENEYNAARAAARRAKAEPPSRKSFGLPPMGSVQILEAYMNATGESTIEIPNAEDEIVERFGADNVAIFTGSVTPEQAQKNLAKWRRSDRKPMILVATMEKGGTGLSLHDKVGNHPTTQINVILPWTASKVAQVTQRSARYGLRGVAKIDWLFSPDIELDQAIAAKVGARMQSMGALVRGEIPKVATNIANFEIGDEDMDGDPDLIVVGEGGDTPPPSDDQRVEVPDLPGWLAEAIAASNRPDVFREHAAAVFGERERESAKSIKATVEQLAQIERAKASSMGNQFPWNQIEEKARQQLGLDENWLKPGSREQDLWAEVLRRRKGPVGEAEQRLANARKSLQRLGVVEGSDGHNVTVVPHPNHEQNKAFVVQAGPQRRIVAGMDESLTMAQAVERAAQIAVTPTQGPVAEALDNLKAAWKDYSDEARKMRVRPDPRREIQLQFRVYVALYKFAEAAIKVGAQSAADMARMAGVRLNGLVTKAWDHAKAGLDFEQYVPDDQDAVDIMGMGDFIGRLDRAAGQARAAAGPGAGTPEPPPGFAARGTGKRKPTEGLFKGRYETMAEEAWHDEAVRWVDAYGSDLEAALTDAASGDPDIGMDNRAARNYVLMEIMNRATSAAKTTKDPAVSDWILRTFMPKVTAAYSANATEAGRDLGAMGLAQERYSYLNPILTLLNLIKERQKRLPFPEIKSEEIRDWLKGVRRKVVEDILRETSLADNVVKRVFNRTARDMGINWSEIMASSLEVQRNVFQAIYDSILAHPILSTMPDDARVELANILGKQFQAKRDEIAKREIAKYVAPKPNKRTQDALIEAFPRILRWANLGVFDDAGFRDAVAPFFGVASFDSGIVQQVTDMAQQAQAVGGENRKRILLDMYRLIQRTGGTRWGDVISDYWYASVLSGTRTQVDNFMNLPEGLLKTAALGLTTPRKVEFFKAYGSGVAQAAWDFFPILVKGELWRSKSFDGDRAPSALAALADSRNGFARILSRAKYVSQLIQALDHLGGLGVYRAGIVDALARRGDDAAINRFLTPTKEDLADARTRAENEGTPANRMNARVREILEEQLPAEVILDARALMKATNFTNAPKGFAGVVYNMVENASRSQNKALKATGAGFVAKMLTGTSFLRYATNRFNDYLDFMAFPALVRWYRSAPGGPMQDDYRPSERRLLLAKAGIGAALGSFAAALFLGDDDDEKDRTIDITGSFKGIAPSRRKQLMDEGRKPYSVRVGGKYYSYRQWGFGSILGVIGELRDRQLFDRENWDQENLARKLGDAAAAGLLIIRDSSAISGLTEFLGASSAYKYDSEEVINKSLPRYFARIAGGFVPNILKEVDAWAEPSIFKANTGSEYFVQQVPFLRRTVGPGPVLNVLGEPVAIERYPWSRWITARKEDAAWQTLGTLASKGVFLPTIGKRMVVKEDGTRREMTPAEEHRFQKAVGRAYREFVMENRFDLTTMPKAEAAAFIDKQTERIRNRTAKEMFGY